MAPSAIGALNTRHVFAIATHRVLLEFTPAGEGLCRRRAKPIARYCAMSRASYEAPVAGTTKSEGIPDVLRGDLLWAVRRFACSDRTRHSHRKQAVVRR